MSDKYKNNQGVYIDVHTDKRGTDHVSFYDEDPQEENHESIHINWDSNTGTGTIVDTTGNDKDTTDISCFLTTACMRYNNKDFNDSCEELTILRWFRDKFVPQEDIDHYYETAPIIVTAINESKNSDEVFDCIYDNVIAPCVDAIKRGDYDFAYKRYKSSVLILEEEFARPKLENDLIKVLKLKKNC